MTARQLADCDPTWDPDDEDDGPWCRTDAPGLLPGAARPHHHRDPDRRPAVTDDMRRGIVLREINQVALAGFQSEITGQAADLVLAALDRYDTWAAGKPAARLARIAEAHSKHVTVGGLTDGDCNECGHPHPCPTWIWATSDRDPLATWDPADDEEATS